jgi:hypothetical protein
MTSETERLRTNIEETRAAVGEDVDALAEKVDPRKVAERRMDAMRETATGLKDRVMGTAEGIEHSVASAASTAARVPAERTRGNPLAVGLIAFGAGWLLSTLVPVGEKEKAATQRAMDAAEPLKSEAMDAASRVTEGMREPVQQAAEHMKESASSAADEVMGSGSPESGTRLT